MGAQKSGTTTLFYYLRQHFYLYVHPDKELNFFNLDENYFVPGTRHPDYERYHSLFAAAGRQVRLGEVTPLYMSSPDAIRRIHRYNPAMSLIFILRNPIERAYSEYQLVRRDFGEPRSFLEVARDPKGALTVDYGDGEIRESRFVVNSLFAQQIKCVLKLFPRKQCLFLTTKEFAESRQATMTKTYNFLGVSARAREVGEQKFNISSYAPMTGEERDFLRSKLLSDIDELESLLGWDLSEWKS